MENESGRVPAEPGSREPSPSVSTASGFDPSRDILYPGGSVYAAIAKVLGWPDSERSKLDARLKNYRRLSFPPDLPVSGRGKEQYYSFRQAFDMLAVAHLNIGIPAQAAINQYMDKRETFQRTGEAGKPIIYRPRSALADLQDSPHRKGHVTLFWNVGGLWRDLAAVLESDSDTHPTGGDGEAGSGSAE